MPDVILTLAEEHSQKTKEELSKVFDDEVERLSKYMASVGDWKSSGPLNDFEKMLIKTYLVQKFAGHLDEVK